VANSATRTKLDSLLLSISNVDDNVADALFDVIKDITHSVTEIAELVEASLYEESNIWNAGQTSMGLFDEHSELVIPCVDSMRRLGLHKLRQAIELYTKAQLEANAAIRASANTASSKTPSPPTVSKASAPAPVEPAAPTGTEGKYTPAEWGQFLLNQL